MSHVTLDGASRLLEVEHQQGEDLAHAVRQSLHGGRRRRGMDHEEARFDKESGSANTTFSGVVYYLKWTRPLDGARREELKNDLTVSVL